MGGVSPERDVSLDTGTAVCGALTDRGHKVVALDTGAGMQLPDRQSKEVECAVKPDPPSVRAMMELDKQETLRSVNEADLKDTDVVFIALHGGAGENGTVQALLELAGVPYTGSAVLSSAIAMDKDMSKKIFERESIPTPRWTVVSSRPSGDYGDCINDVLEGFDLPFVVKPADGGSTIGLTIVKSEDQLAEALREAGELSGKIMVEDFIEGRELTVAVLDGEPLPVVEIIPSHEYYDYECKYSPGMSEYVVPAEIDDRLAEELQLLGEKAYRALDCTGYARVDFRVSPQGEPFCLEVNTLPGMTTTSLVPKAAKAAGILFAELVERICDLAVKGAKR
jgi:D-alanine-D-alanine ligase